MLETQSLTDAQTFHTMYELAFGALAHQPPPPQELSVLAENADEVFDKLATEPKYAMRRPMMLPQLLRAVHDKKSTQHQLANIFARDPALAGNLLKVANSPVYRVSEDPVESLDRAVAMLGTDGLHSLIATVLVQPVFKLAATHYPRFPEIVWEHTFRAASGAENHAAQVENADPFAAQLLALTMGLGAIVVYRIVIDRAHTLLDGRTPHPAVIISLIDSQCAGCRQTGGGELGPVRPGAHGARGAATRAASPIRARRRRRWGGHWHSAASWRRWRCSLSMVGSRKARSGHR